MKEVCQLITRRQKEPPLIVGLEVPPEVKSVAELFVDLQQERHDADYNRGRWFERAEAKDRIAQLEIVLQGWERVRTTPAAQSFLILLLLGKRINR